MDEQEPQNQEWQSVPQEDQPAVKNNTLTKILIGVGLILSLPALAMGYFIWEERKQASSDENALTEVVEKALVHLSADSPVQASGGGYKIKFTIDRSFPRQMTLVVFEGEECKSVSTGYNSDELLNSFVFAAGTEYTYTFPNLTSSSIVCAQLWEDFYKSLIASNPILIVMELSQDEPLMEGGQEAIEETAVLPKLTQPQQKSVYTSSANVSEWNVYSARNWYGFLFSYPSKWLLKPVTLLHGRMFLELEHDIKSDNGDPVARIFLEARRFGGGQALDEWHKENLDELMTSDWLVGSVDQQQNISKSNITVKGIEAVEQKNNILTGWSRSTFVPSSDSILAVHLLGVGASLNSSEYKVINNFYDAIISELAFFEGDFSDEELARYEEIITEIGQQNIECNKATPGFIDITFRETTSVADVKDFIAKTLFNVYGFGKSDMFDLNFGNILYQWLFEEDSPYLGIEYSATEKKGENMLGIRDSLVRDYRVKNVYYNGTPGVPYSLNTSRTIGVELYNEALPKDFLSDYPGLILLPSDIRILYNYDFDRAELSPTTKPFGIRTLSDDIILIDAFKKQLSIESPRDTFYVVFTENFTYPPGPRFEIVFPHQYSITDIKEFVKKVAGENFSYKGPNKISLGLYVGVGNEEKWTKTFINNIFIEKIKVPEAICFTVE